MTTGSPADVAAAVARRAAAKAALAAAAEKAKAAHAADPEATSIVVELDEPITVEAGDTIDVPLLDFNRATMREPDIGADDYVPMPAGAQAFLDSLCIDTTETLDTLLPAMDEKELAELDEFLAAADEPVMEDWERDTRAAAAAILDAQEAAEKATEGDEDGCTDPDCTCSLDLNDYVEIARPDDEPETMDAGEQELPADADFNIDDPQTYTPLWKRMPEPGQVRTHLGNGEWGWTTPPQTPYWTVPPMPPFAKPNPHAVFEHVTPNVSKFTLPDGRWAYYDAQTGDRIGEPQEPVRAIAGPPGPAGPMGAHGLDGRDGHDTRLTGFLADTVTLLDGCHTQEDLDLIAIRVEAARTWFGSPGDPVHDDVDIAYRSAVLRATMSGHLDRLHEDLLRLRTEADLNETLSFMDSLNAQGWGSDVLAERVEDLTALGEELLRPFVMRRHARRQRKARLVRRWEHLRAAFSATP